jgi:type III secretion protein V
MKRYISYKYTRGNSTLPVYLIAPEIEARLNQIEAQPLNNEERGKLIGGVLKEARYSPSAIPVILTSIETRRVLRKLLEREFPWLAVLSYQELSPEMNIQPLARISWA